MYASYVSQKKKLLQQRELVASYQDRMVKKNTTLDASIHPASIP